MSVTAIFPRCDSNPQTGCSWDTITVLLSAVAPGNEIVILGRTAAPSPAALRLTEVCIESHDSFWGDVSVVKRNNPRIGGDLCYVL